MTTTGEGPWTGPLPAEGATQAAHRKRQGDWRRTHLGWPAGEPQHDKRVRERYPTLPNWLAAEYEGRSAAEAGVNLMSDEARRYARNRLEVLSTIDGKAEPDRFWRNLLSSQPLAFSIAGHLRAHPDAAAQLLSGLLGEDVRHLARLSAPDGWSAYNLDGIEAEWFPPREQHTRDMSGCDIAACVETANGNRTLVTVEVKYTDTFSAKPVEWVDRYERHLRALGLDRESTADLARAGCSQVLRQVMVTDSVRRSGLADGAGDEGEVNRAVAVVLAREDDEAARKVVATLDEAVGHVVPVRFWSHRQLIEAAGTIDSLSAWADDMAARYL